MSKPTLNDIADDLTPWSNLPGVMPPVKPPKRKRKKKQQPADTDDLTPRSNLPGR